MLKSDLFKDLNVVLGKSNDLKPNYKKLLEILFIFYKKIDEQLIIQDYSLTKKHHYVSFKKEPSNSFVFIELTNRNLELRFLSIEQMFFFDEAETLNKLELLLDAFFRGKYYVETHRSKTGNPIYHKITWKNEELINFNKEYSLTSNTDKLSMKEKIEGIVFLR